MNKASDKEIAKRLNKHIERDYTNAISALSTAPDYSLLKFREVLTESCDFIFKKKNYESDSDTLHDSIDELYRLQFIDSAIKNEMHEARTITNIGAHCYEHLFKKGMNLEEANKYLCKKASNVRTKLISILEFLNYLVSKEYCEIIQDNSKSYSEKEILEIVFNVQSEAEPHYMIAKLFKRLSYRPVLQDISQSNFVEEYDLSYIYMREMALAQFKCCARILVAKIYEHDNCPLDIDDCNLELIVEELSPFFPDLVYEIVRLTYIGISSDEENQSQIKYYKQLAELGHIDSMEAYSFRVKKDIEESWKFMLLAAESGSNSAKTSLFSSFDRKSLSEEQIKTALNYLLEASADNHPEALYYYGAELYRGRYFKKDLKKSKALLMAALKMNLSTPASAKVYIEAIEKEEV